MGMNDNPHRHGMIHAEVEIDPPALAIALDRLLSLPYSLRPTRVRLGEDEQGDPIDDVGAFVQSFVLPIGGVLLEGVGVGYDIRRRREAILCHAFFEAEPSAGDVRSFMTQLAIPGAIFGYACAEEEWSARNEIRTEFGVNTMDSKVGRDSGKYIPGLYWWTLIPSELARRFDVSIGDLANAAREYVEVAPDLHLFRFYEKPQDWQSSAIVRDLYDSLPGLFQIDRVRAELECATNYLEISAITRKWR
jgi:hypothetical protein